MAIADKINENKEINATSQFTVAFFLMTMCLQIISFLFLFNYRSTEYIVYIFSFIIFCVSPFVWINDLLAVGSVLNTNSIYFSLFQYKEISLVISSLLLFLGIFLVLLTNENVRAMKVGQKHKAGEVAEKTTSDENVTLNSLWTSNSQEAKNKLILKLYATVVILSWGLVIETFSGSATFGKKIKEGHTDSGFAGMIGWLLNMPQTILIETDKAIHRQTDPLTNVTPFVKAFSAYFVTFIILFFGLFLRIPIGVTGVNYNKIHVVNMENIYNAKFFRNIDQNRNIAIFFTCWILSFLLWGSISYLIEWLDPWSNIILTRNISVGTVIKSSFFLFVILIFGSFFGKRDSLDPRSVQLLIMFLLSVLCSILGTPVLVGLIQFILELSGYSLNEGTSLLYCFGVCFALLFSIVMSYGKQWIMDDAYKRIQIFNAVLVCMAVSLFIGLSTTYNMFTNAYNVFRFLIEAVFVFIVPLLIVILSLILFAFAFKSYQKGLIMTDG